MDAREYLARKGLDGSRDEARPNSLEEQAWERARQSGGQQPRAGTPHDWEDWERYHQVLAEGASIIEQKFDREVRRQRAEAHEPPHQAGDAVVQEYTPSAGMSSDTPKGNTDATPPLAAASTPKDVWQAAPASRFAYGALALLFPPAAVGLSGGGTRRILISLALTLLGWLPGCIYAGVWLRQRIS